MNKRFLRFLAAGWMAVTLAGVALAALPAGAAAPDFTATASRAGRDFKFSLEQALKRGPVVLYFYPAAYTGGCDLEAHTFSINSAKFEKAGATIIGVSADSIERLNRFSADPDYCAGKFAVASDPKGKIAASYGLDMKPPQKGVTDVNGDPVTHGFFPRTTFVISRAGRIVAMLSSKQDHLKPDEHVTRALAVVRRLKSDAGR
jgi:peroxiredoxin